MPTPGGKPQVGDEIRDRKGAVLGIVQARTDGQVYSVKIKWHGQARPQWLPEFEWWRDHNGWTVTAPTAEADGIVYDALRVAARKVLAAYQVFLDTDDLDALRDSLTELQEALA